MMNDLFHPAVLTIFAILGSAAAQVVGAYFSRRHYRRLNEIYDEIKNSGEANASDRAWLRVTLSDATSRVNTWITAAAAPILGFVLPFFAISELLKKPTTESLDHDIEEIHRARAAIGTELNPADGAFWGSDLRQEAQEHAHAVEWKRSPLLTAWIGLWLMPGFLLSLVAFGATTAVTGVYRRLTEEVSQKIADAFARLV